MPVFLMSLSLDFSVRCTLFTWNSWLVLAFWPSSGFLAFFWLSGLLLASWPSSGYLAFFWLSGLHLAFWPSSVFPYWPVASLGILACERRYFLFGCFSGSRRSVVGLGFAFGGASFFQLTVSWGATEWGASALDTPIFSFHDSVLDTPIFRFFDSFLR